MNTRVGGSPPTYAEENRMPESRPGGVLGEDIEDDLPYEPTHETDSPSNDKVIESSAESKSGSHLLAPLTSENLPEEAASSSTGSATAGAAQSKHMSAFSFMRNIRQAYEERKKAKEAAQKVDFYEKNYGFVPKNVMSTAEWKKARKDGRWMLRTK